jgi:hypothetical protein
MDHYEQQVLALLRERDAVSDEELVARVSSAPELGGSLIVELSEFSVRRPERELA